MSTAEAGVTPPREDDGSTSPRQAAGQSLPARDPALLAALATPSSWASRLWFRAEVRGLERLPEQGPLLLVSTRSGGTTSPEPGVLLSAWTAAFGVRRPLFVAVPRRLLLAPGVRDVVRRLGGVPDDPATVEALLRAGSSVLVQPGGDREAHRPVTARHAVRFSGHVGFAALARRTAAPLVPVACSGGQDTFLPLVDGARLARLLRLPGRGGPSVLPVSLALPWGLDVGDVVGHVPFPAKLRLQVGEALAVPPDADDHDVADAVVAWLEEALATLAGERRLPPLL